MPSIKELRTKIGAKFRHKRPDLITTSEGKVDAEEFYKWVKTTYEHLEKQVEPHRDNEHDRPGMWVEFPFRNITQFVRGSTEGKVAIGKDVQADIQVSRTRTTRVKYSSTPDAYTITTLYKLLGVNMKYIAEIWSIAKGGEIVRMNAADGPLTRSPVLRDDLTTFHQQMTIFRNSAMRKH